jgi:hypothetical protein
MGKKGKKKQTGRTNRRISVDAPSVGILLALCGRIRPADRVFLSHRNEAPRRAADC